MQKKPIFYFENTSETGMDEIPVGSYVIVLDEKNSKIIKFIVIKRSSTVTSKTSIHDYLANNPTLFIQD